MTEPRRPPARPAPLLATLLVAGASGLGSCSDEGLSPLPPAPPYDPGPETCDPVDADAHTTFSACSKGSGVFGRWVLDEAGWPAYEYGLDQNADERATWTNTEQEDRRYHWAAVGNRRINAMVSNDGWVEVVTQDRGVEHLNKVDPAQGWFGGGFSYVDDGEATWSTAYRDRPARAVTRRRFGIGYAELVTLHRDVEVRHRYVAPAGDVPVLVDEVRVTNRGSEPRSLAHYEVFDVARRPIETRWLVSGDPITTLPGEVRAQRDERNALFDERVAYDAEARTLELRRSHAAGVAPPPREAPSEIDHYPGDPFLASLVGEVDDTFTRDAGFFGGGSVAMPEAVSERQPGEGVADGARGEVLSGTNQPRLFAMRSDLELAPGETAVLRYGYGYAPMGQAVALSDALRAPEHDVLAEVRADLASRLGYFAAPAEPALHRELAWHAWQLQASVGQREYFEGPVVPQGSAYLYLHGADGAARDLGLFALPLVYLDPELARAELELYARIQFAQDRRFSYAFQGHGVLDDALGFHFAPSDLPLFFLWGLTEYVGATGDVGFLERRVPFWPKEAEPDATMNDHLDGAVRHFFDVVGTGEHGLVRVGTGDWSDGIVTEAPNRDLAIAEGESVPNTLMAIAVLPRVADLVEPRDPALADEIRERVDGYRAALPAAWGEGFFGRAYFGDGELLRADRVDLEAQVWALIADAFPAEGDRESTIEAIRTQLDEPSPGGATLQPGTMVWPAISGLLTEGYARTRRDLAWAHFVRNTMFSRTLAFPEVWSGIWTGSDGTNGPAMERPGESWLSPATPMVDFPVQNNNQHAMPLFAAIRMAGLEATAEGLRVDPKVPDQTFSFVTRLCEVHQRPGSLRVVYRPTGTAFRDVVVVAPPGQVVASATLDGAPVGDDGAGSVAVRVLADLGRPYEIVVATRPP